MNEDYDTAAPTDLNLLVDTKLDESELTSDLLVVERHEQLNWRHLRLGNRQVRRGHRAEAFVTRLHLRLQDLLENAGDVAPAILRQHVLDEVEQILQ